MTDTSLLPMAAEEAGMAFEELVERIVKLSLEKGSGDQDPYKF